MKKTAFACRPATARITAAAVLFPFLFLTLSGQDYSIVNIPPELLKDAHTVIREEAKLVEVRSMREGRLSFRRAVTLLSKESHANVLTVFYDSGSKVNKIRAEIYDAAGQLVRRIEREEIKDVSAVSDYSIYDDNRLKYIDARHPDFPYTVVFEYEQELSGLQFAVFPDWYVPDYHYSVQSALFSVDVPADFELLYKTLHLNIEPKVANDGKRRVYQWTIDKLEAVPEEPFGPPPGTVLPFIITAPARFQIGSYMGNMDSWKSFGAFIYNLYAGRDQLPPETVAELRALVAGAGSEAAKIGLLYRYLQQHMRYVSVQLGIGGWQPFDAAYVASRKYGDCKALSNFMMAMLHAVGIEAFPALIHSGEQVFESTEDFAAPRFNHVILYIPSQDCWLECTSNNFPVNYLGLANSGRTALLITPQGGRLVQTPKLEAVRNQENNQVDIGLSADGSARVAVKNHSTGADHEHIRHLAELSATQQQEWLHESSKLPTFSIEQLELDVSGERPESTVTYQVLVSRFAAQAGKRLFMPLNGVSPKNVMPGELAGRRQDLVIPRGYTELDTFRVQLPEGYQVESISNTGLRLESDFGSYRLQVEQSEGVLRVYRSLEIREGRWPAARYPELRSFWLDLSKADNQKAVLVQKRN